MATFDRTYKGVDFTIKTTEAQGRWHWSYKLGAASNELRDRLLPSEEVALAEAEREAHKQIDAGAGK
ncbi:MAG: hypothetical protein JWN73_1718 [Betaproteobacteria bacterium]|nr:hypothetical protein [Betaproteobacteria bacterium]